ncbi:hydantoinase/oxoprolinase family protein [Rhodopila sp.]|uniref:hydantoinase/oxoprolinase family protein n=1 Tax=Rhodopila sp. TaxID=2480087 RepID=UPI003D0AA78D
MILPDLRYSIGTDVGGTFTDLVFCDSSGDVHCFKIPSTPTMPGESILTGVDEIHQALRPPADAWREAHHTHSSTVATNALIERRGARVGLITTFGFRDLFELQRLAIPHPMRFDSRRPTPLVPRDLVHEVHGRIGPDGSEIEPLDQQELIEAARALVASGVEIAVVTFIHSYHNPAHERLARELVVQHGIDLRLELSADIWPQAREYERAVLTTINASVRPIVEAYVRRLTDGLDARGLAIPARIARSNGGAELARTMRDRPVVALLSGPAAGVAGAADAAEDAGWAAADLMTLDVGGTSADIGVIRDGQPVLSSEELVGDFPVLIPTVAVSSIGAGGGSIIWVDSAGSLKVGPRSVGADPGPACYGSGSTTPALTDAFLVAGLLTPGQRLGGKLALRLDPARRALATVGQRLHLTEEQVADGAIRVATAMMAAEATRVLARRGVDAPRFRMVAFGGAGPLMAALIAEEIAIDTILIPPFPGALSALGAARADIAGDLVHPIYTRLHKLSSAALAAAYQALRNAAETWIDDQSSGVDMHPFRISYAAEMRYEGQGYDVPVALEPDWLANDDRDSIAAAFHAAHRSVYGHATEANEVWLKELRVHLSGAIPRPRLRAVRNEDLEPDSKRPIRLFGQTVEAAVVSRSALGANGTVQGPTILNQMDTTTLIPPGWQASLAPSGAMILRHTETKAAQ